MVLKGILGYILAKMVLEARELDTKGYIGVFNGTRGYMRAH